jgi:hypothetical protein
MSWMDDLDEETAQKIKAVFWGGIGIAALLTAIFFIFNYLVADEGKGRKGAPAPPRRQRNGS